jgi:hypothetical protein
MKIGFLFNVEECGHYAIYRCATRSKINVFKLDADQERGLSPSSAITLGDPGVEVFVSTILHPVISRAPVSEPEVQSSVCLRLCC